LTEKAYLSTTTQSETPKQEILSETPKQETIPNQVTWPDPMEINLIRPKEPDDLATIKCQIKSLLIPSAIVDTGASISVITKDLAERLNLVIDKNNINELTGAIYISGSKSIGTAYNVPITIGENNNIAIIETEFAVIDGEKNKPFVLLGVPWLHKPGWDPIAKREFNIIYNGKDIKIPLSIHKSTHKKRIIDTNLKKKQVNNINIKSDRTCKYCNKVFKFPVYLKRHNCQFDVKSNQFDIKSNQFDVKSNQIKSNINNVEILIDPLEAEKIDRNIILQDLYYKPDGYYQSAKKLLEVYIKHSDLKLDNDEKKQLLKDVKEWLEKQAIYQIHSPKPNYIPRASFNQIKTPNEYHQIDILYLPHDIINNKSYKYCLTIVDVASRYKYAIPLIDRSSVSVAKALRKIYNDKKCLLNWPKVIMCDDGGEFKQKVSKMLEEKNIRIKIGNSKRSQAIVERFNRTLAERLFRVQDAKEMVTGNINNSWVNNLQIVIDKLNSEVTRLIGLCPNDAIKKDIVNAIPSKINKNRLIGFDEDRLSIDTSVRYLLDGFDIKGKRRATDPNWSWDI